MVSICFVENMPKVSAAEFCRNNKEKCKYVETTQNPSHFLQQAHLLFLQQAHIITHLTLCCSWFSLNIVLGGMARHLLTLFSFVQRTCIPEIICFVQTFVCKPALWQEQVLPWTLTFALLRSVSRQQQVVCILNVERRGLHYLSCVKQIRG